MTTPLQYRASPWRREPTWRSWWALARHEGKSLFKSRGGVLAFLFCLTPGLIQLVMLLVIFGVLQFGSPGLRNQRSQGSRPELAWLDPRNIEFYVEPVLHPVRGMLCVLLLTAMTLARSIARDRSTNALELYWTRGITPRGYLLAKWLGGALPLAGFTMAMPAFLWLMAVLLNPDWTLLQSTWLPMLRAEVALLVVTIGWSGLPILISAAAHSANGAMVTWIGLLVGSGALAKALGDLLRAPELPSRLSIWEAGASVTRVIAGVPQRHGGLLWSAALLAGLALVVWLRARARLRVTEAVA
jgi:hypothetical protein